MPVTTSSQPEFAQLFSDGAGGPRDVIEQFGMGMQIVTPGGDLAMQVGATRLTIGMRHSLRVRL